MSRVILEASVTFYLSKQTQTVGVNSVRRVQTVNPLVSPSQQANDMALSNI